MIGLKHGANSQAVHWGVIALAAIAFFFYLGRTDIVTSHEARVVQTARLMGATGWPWRDAGVDVPAVEFFRSPDGRKFFRNAVGQPPIHVNPWLIPVADGEIRLQKPPLPYWFAAIFYRLFRYDEFYSRLPSAIMGFAAIFLMIDLARRLISNRAGLWAGLIWISTLFIVDSYRKAMADPELTFFTLLCLWSWIRFSRGGAPGMLLLFYVSLALGTFAKGPVIYLHLLIAITIFSICYHQWPRGRWQWIWHLLGIGLLLGIFLPWPIYVMHRLPHALDLWRYESVGEFADNVEDARPWWFYLPNLFLIPLPWTVVGLIGAARVIGKATKFRSDAGCTSGAPRQYAQLFPLLWIVFTVLIFSFSNLKKNMYLLPMMPGVVLLCVQGIFTLSLFLRSRRLRPTAIIIMGGMGVAVLVVAAVSIHSANRLAEVDVIAIPAMLLGILAVSRGIRGHLGPWLVWQSAAGALAITALVVFHSGERDNLRSARPVVAAALPLSAKGNVAFHNVPMEASVYLPLNFSSDPDAKYQVIFTPWPRGSANAYQNQFPDQQVLDMRLLPLPGVPKMNPWKAVVLTVGKK